MQRLPIQAPLATALLSVASSPVALADFKAEFIPPGQTFPTETLTYTTSGPGLYIIPIEDPNNGTWRVYSTAPSSEGIAQIQLTGSTSGRDIDLVVGRPGVIYNPFQPQPASAYAVSDWYNGASSILQPGGANVRVQANVLGELGNLSALSVGGIRAGLLTSNIFSASSETVGIIDCDDAAPGTHIESINGDIFLVDCGDFNAGTGNFIGDVVAAGQITTVQAGGFLIGDISAGTSI